MEPQSLYQRQLQQELTRRQQLNPSYSLRAFSRNLGMSPAFLSKLLRNEKGLSEKRAHEICKRLGYSRAESESFCRVVRGEQNRKKKTPEDAQETKFSIDQFQMIAEWYHTALAEMTELKNFSLHYPSIAKSLGIPEQDAKDGIARLIRLGLLQEQEGKLQKCSAHASMPHEIPSRAIRNHHHQMMSKAQSALESQGLDERHIESLTFAVDADKIAAAKNEIRRFSKRLAKLMDTRAGDEVYQFNVQLFRLTGEKK